MKDKRIIAMFITSIFTFVASLTISLGIANALADPTAAVGLTELNYTISDTETYKQSIVFQPTCGFDGDIADYSTTEEQTYGAVVVNNYNDIMYADGHLQESIKLVKVSVTNNTQSQVKFMFNISVEDKEAQSSAAVTDSFRTKIYLANSDRTADRTYINGEEITISENSTMYFVVACYFDINKDTNGQVSYLTSKTVTIELSKN